MKRIISILVLTGVLIVPLIGIAAPPPKTAPTIDTMDLLDRITNWLFAILLIVAALCIIIAGFLFVTAAGDANQTQKARDFILYALIGVLVAFAAKGLVLFIEKIVT